MIVSSASEEFRIVSTKLARFGVQIILQQEAGHPHDGVHRRADFMAHAGQEIVFGAAGGFRRHDHFLLVGDVDRGADQPRRLSVDELTFAVLLRHRMVPGSGTMRNSTEYGSPVANARSAPLASSQRSSGCTISLTSSTCLPALASDTPFESCPGFRPLHNAG